MVHDMRLLNANSTSSANVLLVEDNRADAIITRKAFEATPTSINLYWVEHGLKCMQFLRKEGNYADVPTPDLVLLDINMPVMNGREVLAQIVNDDQLRKLPVVILTTSKDDRDLVDMYRLRCNSYIVKPVDFESFRDLVAQVANYWFTVVLLPPTQ